MSEDTFLPHMALELPSNIPFEELSKRYQTPFFIYDFNKIKHQFLSFKNAFKARKSLICYALKANSNLSVLKLLASLGAGADCVSIGEVTRALKVGIKPYKIIYSGVGKSDEEIEMALKYDILFINVESFPELKRIENIAKSLDKKARISVRVNPNIDAKTHPYISTGLHENKFGVDIDTAKAMYIYIKNSSYLEAVGIHFHIGSQLTDLSPIKQAASKIAELTHSLLALKLNILFFDIGGGVGIRYTDESTIDLTQYAQAILESMRGLDMTIIAEPGRYIVGESGYLVSKVLYQKSNGDKKFVIIDAAMNDLVRPTLYSATHQVYVDKSRLGDEICDVVGPICESGDFLAKNVKMANMEHDDLVVLGNAGAYGASMSSNYNTRLKALELGFENQNAFVIKNRENLDNLLKDELELAKNLKI